MWSLGALENHLCVCMHPSFFFFCVQYCCFWAYITACASVCVCLHVYCTPAPPWQEQKGPACWRWWQDDRSKRSLFFHYFIVNTARGFRERALLALRKWKHRQAPGRRNGRGGGEDEAWKCSAPSNSHDATPQSIESSAFFGYSTDDWVSAYWAFSATLRGGLKS